MGRDPAAVHRVGLIPGDGIGPEVTREAVKVLDATGAPLEWVVLDWGTDRFLDSGGLMPADWADVLLSLDSVLFGAVGDPRVADHISLWNCLLPIRQVLDLWVNIRPMISLSGVEGPLRDGEDVDVLFLRENTEGEYAGVGGRAHAGVRSSEVALDVSVFSRKVIKRLMTFAFQTARRRRGLVTSATKSNASRFAYVLWDEVAEEVSGEFPDITYECVLVDALAARLVLAPRSLDVVVASNLFADILTDVGAAIQGGVGLGASANVAPGDRSFGVFEPIHGSAPTIVGKGIANPIGAIWSGALMLDHLGERVAADRVVSAVREVTESGVKTPDVGGMSSTFEVGNAIAAAVVSPPTTPAPSPQ